MENNKKLYDKLLINESNKGKGFSVKKGLLSCLGTHVAFQDGDLEYNPNDLLKLQKMFVDFDADGVIGSRFNYSDFTMCIQFINFYM